MRPTWMIALVLTSACVPPRRATSIELHGRAIFDLGCPANMIHAYPLGPRTSAMMGCGRRLVYVERCDAGMGSDNACAWVLDTPSFVQGQWPQGIEAQMALAQQWAASRPPSWPAPAAPTEGRVAQGDAGRDPLAVPTAIPVPPPTMAPPRSRRVHVDLFDDAKTAPAPRTSDDEVRDKLGF